MVVFFFASHPRRTVSDAEQCLMQREKGHTFIDTGRASARAKEPHDLKRAQNYRQESAPVLLSDLQGYLAPP